MDTHLKQAGMRIRVEPELRQRFIDACRARDLTAAQVLRAFMRDYVDRYGSASQLDLFNSDSLRDAFVQGGGEP